MVSGINMISPLRYCTHIKHMNYTPIVFNHPNVGYVFSGLVHRVNYSQDKKGCCKDIAQTTGKKVEPWPKTDPPTTPWRAECSHDPQPPNYDPYKIKVPDVVVPPLPASNVKRTGVVYTTTDQHGPQPDPGYQHQHHQYPAQSGYPGIDQQVIEEEETKDPGFFGRLKGFFGKLKGKGKEGEGDAMISGRDVNWLPL
uniref:SFRICE_006942 n=1 Tax=Spodoptera frugiperda TaxID=7108 RepID=A0A2H1WXM5_SPOFR